MRFEGIGYLKKNARVDTCCSTQLVMVKMSSVIRVLFTLDSFWVSLDLHSLALLARISRECDITFAVSQMPLVKDKQISKMWAKRWLGLSLSWVQKIKKLTLIMALNIAKEHGGLAKTHGRALRLQAKETETKLARQEAKTQTVLDAEARKLAIKVEYAKEQAFIANVQQVLSAVPRAYFEYWKIFPYYRQKMTIQETVVQIQLNYEQDMIVEKRRQEKKRLLDKRLLKEKLPCFGFFYDECIREAGEITNAMIAEIRFRSELWKHFRYDYIVDKLAMHGFYKGINADARTIFRKRFNVSDKGYIGALNLQYDMAADIRRCRILHRPEYSDDDWSDSESD